MSTAERVAAGMAFLDEHDPQWWRAIDLDDLDLGDPALCVLGQRCPLEVYDSGWPDSRYTAMAKLWSGSPLESGANTWAAARGFQVTDYTEDPADDRQDAEYDDLTAEWARVIRERRSA